MTSAHNLSAETVIEYCVRSRDILKNGKSNAKATMILLGESNEQVI